MDKISLIENTILLADPNSTSWKFAERIKDYLHSTYSLKVPPLKELSIKFFRNGEIDMEVPENVRRKDVYFIHDSSKNPQEWWVELLLLKDLLLSASVETASFVLPNMLYSRKDWKDRPHVPISARALDSSISPGLKRIITMDLHAADIQGFYPDSMPLDNLPSYPTVINYMKKNSSTFGELEKIVIVTPDVGGAKRAENFAKNAGSDYPIAIVDKRRDPITGKTKSVNLVGDVENKDCLIFDDIIDSGGTLCDAADLLKKKGAKKVYCYATHGLFTNGREDLCCSFDKVMTSNTYYRESFPPVEIIDMSSIFAEAIYQAQTGGSITELFKIKKE
jgi:ribose-phosphate pyrophosphokinase